MLKRLQEATDDIAVQETTFTRDVMGRYVLNTWSEMKSSADASVRPDARPFDLVIVGGGTFGPALAQHLLNNDQAHSHRILVLEAGHLLVAEHVQNLPLLGLGVPGPLTVDPGQAYAEVWGLPWRSDVPRGFPGLAYCLGGRSLYFGGWSPRFLDIDATNTEMPTTRWPAAVVSDLNNKYFKEASEQIGVSETNDFIYGQLHNALRQRLADGINANQVPGAFSLAVLPDHPAVPVPPEPPATKAQLLALLGLTSSSSTVAELLNLLKLEAPLAVQGRPTRSGFFPFSKFSSLPLIMAATRAAQGASGGDDVKKRLMVVPNVHATRLITVQEGAEWRVTGVETSLGVLDIPPNGNVVVALGTIESARLAKISFPDLPNAGLIGANLMAHLRSNLTIRVPVSALPAGLPNELQASALFLKGRLDSAGKVSFFHLQITAAGLDKPTTDTEPELFKMVPDFDSLLPFFSATDDTVVMTIRGIGEMEPDNPNTKVTLSGELDEYHYPRAFVSINPNARDGDVWNAMDTAADHVATVIAGASSYEVLDGGVWRPLAAGQLPSTVMPFVNRRDGLGTTHHEAGTLRMGGSANTSVTNADARFHHVKNAYAVGPALLPTVGSPNPMQSGIALVRRLGDHLASPPSPYVPPEPGFTALFNGFATSKWRMSTISNQPPDKSNPGNFIVVDGSLESTPGNDLGLYWYSELMPADFVLKLEWLRWTEDGNSGVFVRFPHPNSKGYNNTAYVGVDFGFEVQIDQFGAPDGQGIHKDGAIYNEPGQTLTLQPAKPATQWNEFEIRVQGQTYTVFLNGAQVTVFNNPHAGRGLPSAPGAPSFIGLQSHFGSRVAFRRIRMKPL
jgi:choline dehydrogenase-like flavoprotein